MTNSDNNSPTQAETASAVEMSYGEKIAALQLENTDLLERLKTLEASNVQLLSLIRDGAQPAESDGELPIHVRPFPLEDVEQVTALGQNATVVAGAGLQGGMQPDHVMHLIKATAQRMGLWSADAA